MLFRASFIETRDCGAENFIKHFREASDADSSCSKVSGISARKSVAFSKNEAGLSIG